MTMAESSPPSGSSTKRQYVLTLLVIAGASALAWWATASTWAIAEEALLGDGSGQFASAVSQVPLSAAAIAPAAAAMPILGFAGLAGVLGSRGLVRRFVGLVIVGAGVVLVWSGLDALTSVKVQGAAPGGGEIVTVAQGYIFLTLITGVVLTLAGIATAVFGASWPSLGSNYERADSRPRDAWEAMDAGLDPTQVPEADGVAGESKRSQRDSGDDVGGPISS